LTAFVATKYKRRAENIFRTPCMHDFMQFLTVADYWSEAHVKKKVAPNALE
jgi:hypothetical protein